jgi:RimJ/RimL family protein N-acetyltransferase
LTSAPNIFPLAKEKEILERISKEGYTFAIIEKEKETVIGNCGLMNVDFISRKADLGIFIGDKELRGKGYGAEAIMLLLDFAFNILNLNNIMLTVKEFNSRAIKCYEKCGFKTIGRRREAEIFGSKRYDEIYMDVLASEFTGNYVKSLMDSI